MVWCGYCGVGGGEGGGGAGAAMTIVAGQAEACSQEAAKNLPKREGERVPQWGRKPKGEPVCEGGGWCGVGGCWWWCVVGGLTGGPGRSSEDPRKTGEEVAAVVP